MQFIEKNSFNVRSAIYHLTKDGVELEFLMFPMIHVGSQDFYDDIGRRLLACDLILAEGLASKRASLLTLSYRIVKGVKRMDLVTQSDGLTISNFQDKVVNSDMTGRAFDERWSSLPLFLRAQLFLLIPVYAVYLLLFGTRETLVEVHLGSLMADADRRLIAELVKHTAPTARIHKVSRQDLK